MLGGSGFRKRLARAVFLGFASLGLPQSVHAQTVSAEEFYKGKVLTFFVGSGEGGSFGIYGQVLAQHMSRYLPGQPRIIVRYFGGQSGGFGWTGIYKRL